MLMQGQGVLKLFSHLYVKQLLMIFFSLPHNLEKWSRHAGSLTFYFTLVDL